MLPYIVTGAGLTVYLVVAWFLGNLLGLGPAEVRILRIGLTLIGLIAAGAAVWYIRTNRAAKAGQSAPQTQQSLWSHLAREANTRLAQARALSGGRRLPDVPLFLILGEAGSAKTSIMLQSGLEPELLAGNVYNNGAVTPTETGNIWFAAGCAWVEAGGAVLFDENALRDMARHLSPRRMWNILGGSRQAPRAVIVCADTGDLASADAASAVPARGRRMNAVLLALANRWQVKLPVYVLWTKSDRLLHFADFVHNFQTEEVAEPFGVGLPASGLSRTGAYAAQSSHTFGDAFEQLFRGLAARRLDALRRENDPARSPNIYEHPREFRKVRDHLVRYLVEICRPSQLQESPFLRGFYFTGVRPVVAQGAPAAAKNEGVGPASGATQIFRGSPAPAPAFHRSGTQRVPQWVYLAHWFGEVLLKDRAALGAGATSAGAGRTRLILFAVGAALCAALIVATTVSYSRNRALIGRIRQADATLRSSPMQLAALDDLRQAAEQLAEYVRVRTPLSFRWGLFPGAELETNARNLYCGHFNTMLGNPVRASLAAALKPLPPKAGPQDNYESSYRALKAYLIGTYENARFEPWIPGFLMERWAPGRNLTEQQAALAREQFRAVAYCPANPDREAIVNARIHLLSFELIARVYQNMSAHVSSKFPAVTFADPGGAMVDRVEVPGAFTKNGWPAMQAAIESAPEYFNREPWVLGQSVAAQGSAELTGALRTRYTQDYLKYWQDFLQGAAVLRPNGFKDAAQKLRRLSDAQSPILKLFCMVSEHTSVASPQITAAFHPVHAFAPPAACAANPNAPANADYMRNLLALQVGVERLAGLPDVKDADLPEAGPAKLAARQTGQTLNLPPPAQKILEDPILYAEALVRGAAPAELNGKGKAFCAAVAGILGKYPFHPKGSQQATAEDLAMLLQPGAGLLWKFHADSLQQLIVPQGDRFSPNPGGKLKISDGFLAFFNRAAALSRSLFSPGSPRPGFAYSVQGQPSGEIDNFTLAIDGRTLNGSKRGGETQEFAWPGDASGVRLQVRAKGQTVPHSEQGPWAAVRLFSEQARELSPGPPALIELDVYSSASIGRPAAVNPEKLATLRFLVKSNSAAPVFRREAYDLRCVSTIAVQ